MRRDGSDSEDFDGSKITGNPPVGLSQYALDCVGVVVQKRTV